MEKCKHQDQCFCKSHYVTYTIGSDWHNSRKRKLIEDMKKRSLGISESFTSNQETCITKINEVIAEEYFIKFDKDKLQSSLYKLGKFTPTIVKSNTTATSAQKTEKVRKRPVLENKEYFFEASPRLLSALGSGKPSAVPKRIARQTLVEDKKMPNSHQGSVFKATSICGDEVDSNIQLNQLTRHSWSFTASSADLICICSTYHEREDTQKKTFSKWINYIMRKGNRKVEIKDIVVDLQDGSILLALLEVITGKKLRQEKGRMRVHKINNINRVLEVLQQYDTKLVNIRSEEIVDGNIKLILGLIWSIILHFQVKGAMHHATSGAKTNSELESNILSWCRQCTQRHKEVDIRNFTSSWRDGLAFNAILHHHRPDLFDFNKLLGRSPNINLSHAFEKARTHFGIAALLDPEDVNIDHPDKKSIMMYVTTMYEVLAKLKETESDPGSEVEQAARSDSPTPSSVSTMSEWDDYNETLTQVSTWLLQAETQLKQQEPVSANVDQVKEQFREHEEFMMILTSHQTSVGSVLEFGSQLINEGIVIGKEEKDIREQMAVLSDRWENLRVSAMHRQSELHQHLMKLQQRQLKELADWLTKAEYKMETAGSIGSDLDTVKKQVEEHKGFQEDLENQQQHVNSLSHMVVVVDESESENATADLEEQLATLGERWSAVCKWTEHRWAHLQEILTSWQQYRDEEQRLSKWLHEKEKSLKDISVIDMGDKNQVEKQLQKLKDLEEELTLQQNSFGDFNLAAQRVAQTLEEDSPAITSIQDTMEDFNQRWNLIASMLNAKTKHFKGMEDQLQTFLQELEENISWLNDTEMLLKPQANPEIKLVESLDQAFKKRRTSMIELTRQGEELLKQSASAGQSEVGLKQYINSFIERWEAVTHILDNQKNVLSFSERKKVFVDETQRILITITEITTYVERIFIEMKNNPKEMLIKIEIKEKELSSCEAALEKLWLDCGNVSDLALKSAFEAEYKDVSNKVKTVASLIQEKHKVAVEAVQSTPPVEFSDKTKLVQAIIDETFPFVSKDFKYNEIKSMMEVADVLKQKLDNLNNHEVHLKTLSKCHEEMLKGLSPDKTQRCQKLLTDLNRQWTNCKKVTEARLQRVNEAVTQTKELEVAMRETFNWMDDVDKFLEEITGTIAEGDAETIDSQVQEVEALQQDIATVQKKVDSLIETCSLIIDRAQPNYAQSMQTKLASLKQRWSAIISTTGKQKDNLRNAGLKFQEVDNGVKEIIAYLKSLQMTIQNDVFSKLDKAALETKIREYLGMEEMVIAKGNAIKEFTSVVAHLISTAPSDMEAPQVYKELQLSSSMVSSVSLSIKDTLQKLKTTQKQFEEFEGLIRKAYHSMELLDAAIAKSSEKLDGDDEELQKCLGDLEELLRKFSGEDVKQIDALGALLISSEACVTKTQDMLVEYKGRLDDTKERCKKVQYILEGELMKRQQLRKDLVQIGEWLDKIEKDTSDKIKENADISDEYIDNLKEEISLNEALVSSAERSVKELVNTGRPENHKDLISKLEGIQSRWGGLLKAYEVVQSKPKQKELEDKFFALEGSILSDIDNLRRKIKKVKMTTPEVLDIQHAVEILEDLSKSSDSVYVDIQTLKQYAESLEDSSRIDQQINEIQNEYNGLKDLLKNKEKVLADALPLAESVFANLEIFDNWLKVVNENLQNITVNPLPVTPEESIIKVDNILKEITGKANDIQQLCSNGGNLGQMSEEASFQAMETRVHDIREVYGEVKRDAQDRKDTFQRWRKQLDEYEKKVDELNTWIDSRFATLESIGGLSARLDVEMELEKLKKLISLINSKESELDNLKILGDDISTKGHQSIVGPYEKLVYKRWDELEKKYKNVQSLLEIKLNEVSYQPPEKTAKIITEEEFIIDEPINVLEVESAPPSFFDDPDGKIVPVVAAKFESTPKISSRPITKKYKRETKASLQQSVEDMILEIEAIEASLPNLRTDSENGLKTIQTDVEKIEDHLGELQPDFENIIEEAKDTLKELNNNESNREPILRLSKKFSDVHTDLMIRRQSLQDANFKFTHMKSYLSDCQMWLAGAEKLLQSEKQLENLKEIETSIEQYSARLESVNIRAEQLMDVCSDTLIPKKQIALINKRFHIVSHHFEKYQRPEEKVTSYRVSVETGDRPDAETKANVHIKLFGEYGNSDQLQLRQSETKRKKFQPGQVDLFTFRNQPWLGKLSKIRVWHDNEGWSPAWFLSSIYVLDELSGRLFCFVIDTWLSKENGAVLKEMPVSAVSLSQEASPDIMVKKHIISDMHWLFDTFSLQSGDPNLKPRKELISDIKKEIRIIEEIESKLDHPCFTGKPYDDFSRQDEILKDVEAQIAKTNHVVTHFMMIRERYLAECSQEEMYDIDVNLTGMRSRWNAVNKEFKARYVAYDRNVELWKQFHDNLNALTLFLTGVENQFSNTELSEMEIKEIQNETSLHQEKLNTLNQIASNIILQSSENDGKELQAKLDTLNGRWNQITGEITNRKMRDLLDDGQIKKFMSDCGTLQQALDKLRTTISYQKPHPIDAEELRSCLNDLQSYEDDEVSKLQKAMHYLNNDAKKILSRSDLSPTQLDEIKSRSNSLEKYFQEVTFSFDKQKNSLYDKLSRAGKFLDELAELSAWMSETRTRLEGHREGRPGCQVDPEMIKSSLETRKSNVESINILLKEFKAEGELTSGQFPQDVGEKIARLNVDWQVIIRLAIALKDRPVSEEMVVVEAMQEAEASVCLFENDIDNASSTNTLDKNLAQLHDWLKLVENKLKGLSVVVGDDEDMESALKKLAIIQVDLENRKNDLEDVIEMAAAMNMESVDENMNYAVDDKISKLKEHWELVSDKVFAQKDPLEKLISDWRRFNELRLQLDNFVYKSEHHLDDERKIGTTATEIEEQLKKHKIFRQELTVWSSTYDNLVRVAEHLSKSYSKHDLTEFQNTFNVIRTRWNNLEQRSNARQQSLQEALDRLLLFHQNMISAMTWLSSAESKVAELDSLVEASQAEDSADMDELQREMMKLEDDISSHQSMFHGLNETGQQIMMDLEAGEVRLALQSKLDDMNDRWNSLGVRVVDIRERMSDGTGEWRQLLLDMQEIVDWLSRADQELMSQQPIGSSIEVIQQQSEKHQDFKRKLNVRRVVIEQALEQGHNFLLKHQAQSMDPNYLARNDSNLVQRVASNLQTQLAHIESQWQELRQNSDKWQSCLDVILELTNQLLQDIENINIQLNEAERLRNTWMLTSEIVVDNIHVHLDEVKDLRQVVAGMEPQIDRMNGTAKEINVVHGVTFSNSTEKAMEQSQLRWKQLYDDCQLRHQNLQNLAGDVDEGEGVVPLEGSVLAPWERGQALNKVPYFINHDTKTTTWDHPKMTDLYQTLSELNDVKFAAYRTSMKLRCIQKACCLDLVDLNPCVTDGFDKHGIRSDNDSLIDVGEMIKVLLTIFENVEKSRKDAIDVPQSVDMTLNWLLNVYDSGRIGKLRVLSFKIGIVLMSRAKLEDKWRYLFRQIADKTGHADSKKLGLLLHDCVQIPRQLGEIAAFGGSNIEPSVRSCFDKVKNPQFIEASNFIDWTGAEPQSLVWMPVLHRLAAAETAKHDAKCQICKEYPIIGFRYRCLKCFSYDLCQNCFWAGRVSKSHRVTHPMHQYSLATTTGEDMSDFVKLMKNKFKSRRYRSRPPKKLGYLPVQTIMEGSSIETPSLPTTPDMSFTFPSMNGTASSPETSHRDMNGLNEEHRLIQQMCQSLNGDVGTTLSTSGNIPQSPSQILASLDDVQRKDIDEIIRGLQDEHQSLQEEYNRLQDIRGGRTENGGQLNGTETARDTELLAEAKNLREHKGKLETRMQILEDHNRQLEAQLQKLRQLLEQPTTERHNSSISIHSPPSPSRVTPALTPSSSYHGSPDFSKNRKMIDSPGYSSDSASEFRHVTNQIENAFPIE